MSECDHDLTFDLAVMIFKNILRAISQKQKGVQS